MTSSAKIEANRRNAQKSTGPSTLAGKTIGSMNALKHDLCSRRMHLIPGETEAQFAEFASGFLQDLHPLGTHECFVSERIIMTAWRLRRVPELEAGLLAWEIREELAREEPIHPLAMRSDAYVQLSRLNRHEALLKRTYQESLKELQCLQAERGDDEEDC